MIVKGWVRRWLRWLPFGGIWDRIYVFVLFVYAHRRLPRRESGLLNDYLYFLKISPKILDIFRQITSDKILVKDFVRARCGEKLVLETTAVFDSVDEIDLSVLRKPCVLKPAHGNGSIVFIVDGQRTLPDSDKVRLAAALESSPYRTAREVNYRYLRPRLVCEPMLPSAQETKDYKFFCYRGLPRVIQVDSCRHTDHKRNLYRVDWTQIGIRYNFPIGEWEPAPARLSEMIRTAEVLSAPFDFVRVDFFVYGDRFFVGELTHCPESAHGRFEDRKNERLFSEILFSSDHP